MSDDNHAAPATTHEAAERACYYCGGSGYVRRTHGLSLVKCVQCDGTGRKPATTKDGSAMDFEAIAWAFPAVGAPAGICLHAKHIVDGDEWPLCLHAQQARDLAERLRWLADEVDRVNGVEL